MKLEYQERKAPWAPGGVIHRPYVDLKVIGPTGEFVWPALADTGLDVTLVSDRVVKTLGISLGPEESITGLGGQKVTFRFGDVELELRGHSERYRWRARVAFHAGLNAYLGQDGFFDVFHASFDNDRKRLTIRPHRGARVLIIPIP